MSENAFLSLDLLSFWQCLILSEIACGGGSWVRIMLSEKKPDFQCLLQSVLELTESLVKAHNLSKTQVCVGANNLFIKETSTTGPENFFWHFSNVFEEKIFIGMNMIMPSQPSLWTENKGPSRNDVTFKGGAEGGQLKSFFGAGGRGVSQKVTTLNKSDYKIMALHKCLDC